MKKYLISLLLFVTFFTMTNHIYAAKDLSAYFNVTDFRFCEDVVTEGGRFTCNSEAREYVSLAEVDADNKKVCSIGSSDLDEQFFTIIDWTFDYSDYDGTIQAGDYVSIPLFRDKYEEEEYHTSQQRLMQSGSAGATDLIVNNVIIGTWSISKASTRSLIITFNENINDPNLTKSLQGQFRTAKNFYFSSTHKSTRDITMSIGKVDNPLITKDFCIEQTTPRTPTTDVFAYGINSTSNNYVSWRFISNRGTFIDLCDAFNNNTVMVDDLIYDNLVLEINLGNFYENYDLDIGARIEGLHIPSLTEIPRKFLAVGS